MAFNFLKLLKKTCCLSSVAKVDPSVVKVDPSVAKVDVLVSEEVRYPFLCYYFAGTYADYLNVRSKLEDAGYIRSSRCAAVTILDFKGCFFHVGFPSYTVTLRGAHYLPAGLVYIQDLDDFVHIASYRENVKDPIALRKLRAYWFLRSLVWRPSLSLATINKLIFQYSLD